MDGFRNFTYQQEASKIYQIYESPDDTKILNKVNLSNRIFRARFDCMNRFNWQTTKRDLELSYTKRKNCCWTVFKQFPKFALKDLNLDMPWVNWF